MVGRKYVALVHGLLTRPGSVKLAIGRDTRVPVRMAVEPAIAPKPAVTHYAPVRAWRIDDAAVTDVPCTLDTRPPPPLHPHPTPPRDTAAPPHHPPAPATPRRHP